MEPCSIDSWNMNLFLDLTGTEIARPLFRNVKVDNGKISGDVELSPGHKISDLGGLCVPFPDLGLPEIAKITFIFRLKDAGSEIGIFYTGIAFTKSGDARVRFNGKWIAFPPRSDTPTAAQLVTFALPGSGDTGTGTGSQT